MTYFNRKTNHFEKVLENIEMQSDKEFGTTNVIDIGMKAGFRYNLRDFKKRKIV